GHAQRESRHDVEHHRRSVVVVAEDDDVGLFALLEALHPFVTVENRLPVFLLRAPLVERGADGGNVAGGNAGGNAGHQLPSLIERFPSIGRPPARIIAAYSSAVIPVIEPTAFCVDQPSVLDSLTRK